MKKLLLLIYSVFLLTACTSPSTTYHSDFRHKGISFGTDKNADYKKGVIDACRPIDCGYIKDINRLENNKSYRRGWDEGLSKCKGKEKGEHLYGI